MLGDAIVFQLVSSLEFMPAIVLTSKLCPKDVEATVYALLAGFQNFWVCSPPHRPQLSSLLRQPAAPLCALSVV